MNHLHFIQFKNSAERDAAIKLCEAAGYWAQYNPHSNKRVIDPVTKQVRVLTYGERKKAVYNQWSQIDLNKLFNHPPVQQELFVGVDLAQATPTSINVFMREINGKQIVLSEEEIELFASDMRKVQQAQKEQAYAKKIAETEAKATEANRKMLIEEIAKSIADRQVWISRREHQMYHLGKLLGAVKRATKIDLDCLRRFRSEACSIGNTNYV